MRIKNTTSTDQRQQAVQEIGRIRAGIKKKSDKGIEYPQSTDYFVATGNYAGEFQKLYSDQPRQLEIMFFSDKEADSCDERLEIRNKSGQLYTYGDGETFYIYNSKTERYSNIRYRANDPQIMDKIQAHLHTGLTDSQKKAVKWDHVLYLRFFIANFPILGYWQFATKGTNTSIPAIREVFDKFKESAGSVQGVSFLLTITKSKSNKPDSRDQYPIVKLVPKVSVQEAFLLIERYQNALHDSSNTLLNMGLPQPEPTRDNRDTSGSPTEEAPMEADEQPEQAG